MFERAVMLEGMTGHTSTQPYTILQLYLSHLVGPKK